MKALTLRFVAAAVVLSDHRSRGTRASVLVVTLFLLRCCCVLWSFFIPTQTKLFRPFSERSTVCLRDNSLSERLL